MVKKIGNIVVGALIIVWAAYFLMTGIMLFPHFLTFLDEMLATYPPPDSWDHWCSRFILETIPLWAFFSLMWGCWYFANKGFNRINRVSGFLPIKGKIWFKREAKNG